jgi:hypothetical protein
MRASSSHFIDELRAPPADARSAGRRSVERNELTAILEAEREAWGEEAARVLGGPEFAGASPTWAW